jgi:hypothetical protein
MTRTLLAMLLTLGLPCACSSNTSSGSAASTDGGGACPDLTGSWTVTAHCDASLIGQKAVVTQTDCSLSFAQPFNLFTGTVTTDAKVSLSGPQSCTGTATSGTISMTCTPDTCEVTLAR